MTVGAAIAVGLAAAPALYAQDYLSLSHESGMMDGMMGSMMPGMTDMMGMSGDMGGMMEQCSTMMQGRGGQRPNDQTTGLGILPITVASVALGDQLTGPMWDVWLAGSGLLLALYLGWRWYRAERPRDPLEGLREARPGRSP